MSESRIVSVDVGGTFTDALYVDEHGELTSYKLPTSTPKTMASLLEQTLGQTNASDELLYSTTATLNSLLGGALPNVGLIVTSGFRDILETARLPASAGDAAGNQLPRRLVTLEWVREVDARIEADGKQRTAVDSDQVRTLAREYDESGISVVAVALLHSYINSHHENEIARIFSEVTPNITVVCSSAVLPELREYERTLATALNACLIPVLDEHLNGLGTSVDEHSPRVWLMQSDGGLASAASVAQRPLATALSGPGAAVVGMRWLGEVSGYDNLITLDVGGTSTDVALIKDGRYALTTSGEVAGFPVKIPMLDVLSIGAGGGSIAREAPDRRWHVGPESAGAEPGPACYVRGSNEATLSDAQLVLGRLPNALLGGSVPLDTSRSIAALEAFGSSRGFGAERAARGILEIASHNMAGAIRRVSVLRGHDPSACALLAMGGAGPSHAAELAELLSMPTVVVPPQPGLAAAWGLLVADITQDFVQGISTTETTLDIDMLSETFDKLLDRARLWSTAQGEPSLGREFVMKLDLRYGGMTHETTIECPNEGDISARVMAAVERFHGHFEELTGRSWRDRESVEIVNLRISTRIERRKQRLPTMGARANVEPSTVATRPVGFLGREELLSTAVYAREGLDCQTTIVGPAVIEQYEATTIVPPDWHARIDNIGNLILERKL
jgi:N-methylhydantoinase A